MKCTTSLRPLDCPRHNRLPSSALAPNKQKFEQNLSYNSNVRGSVSSQEKQ